LGANEIPDNHVYSEKVRQNTLRGVSVIQGEHYKVDLSAVDPENAAVTRTSSAEDSVHVEGSSKTREAPPRESNAGSGFIRLNTEPSDGDEEGDAGADGPRTGSSPGAEGSADAKSAESNYSTAGSGSSYIASQVSKKPKSTRTGFLRIGGA